MKLNNLNYKTTLFLLTLLCSLTIGKAQISLTKLDATKLPFDIHVEGKIKDAVRWTDSLGDNIVVTTETGIYKKNKNEEDGRDAQIFAYHFIISENVAKQTWRVYDFISDCPFDIEATFIKNTFQVTDLNKDGIAEIWLMYKTVCHSDVSPCDMKIIMYEGQQKFAIRGQNKVKVSEKEFYGGDYKIDQAFRTGPAEFLVFAKKLWERNIM